MSQTRILHMETATDICSVAVSEDDNILALVESGQERNHARLLNPFMREALKKAGLGIDDLHGVAVSKGPGSYTGLRIGVSTAKGLAYARNLPLLATGTLENLAYAALELTQVRQLEKDWLLCPMIDARRMEVYAGFYNTGMQLVRKVSADIINGDSYRDLLEEHRICFFGNGASKCREVLPEERTLFLEDVHPTASAMIRPVLKKFRSGKFEDIAYFEPFYLKDFVATIPRRKVL